MKNIKLQKIQEASGSKCSRYLVTTNAGSILGMLEKWPNTRSMRCPWKAFVGVGDNVRYLGAYFPEDGGKASALAKVIIVAACEGIAWLELKVVSVSSNTNSFGLSGIILMARDGRVWEVGHCQQPVAWSKGDIRFFPVQNFHENDCPRFDGCEIPRALPSAPQSIIDVVWNS